MPEPKNKDSVAGRIRSRLEGFVGALQRKESIVERFTVRQVDLDLKPTSYGPQQVRETRKLLAMSQSVFAKFLGVSISTVRAWEQGVNVPSDMASRFMDEIRSDPEHWRNRLRDLVIAK